MTQGPAACARVTDERTFAQIQDRIRAWEQVLADVGCRDRTHMRDVGACLSSCGFPSDHSQPHDLAKTALRIAPPQAWMSYEQSQAVMAALSAMVSTIRSKAPHT